MQTERYEYDEETDVLDVYFDENRPVWTIELTPNVLIAIDRATEQAVSLTLLDYTELIRRSEWGPLSFPLTGLAHLPQEERRFVLSLLHMPPVNRWLDVSSVHLMPDSPFAVTHLEAPPPSVAKLLALAA